MVGKKEKIIKIMCKNLIFISTSLINSKAFFLMLHSLDLADLIVVFFTFIFAKFSTGILLLTLYYPLLLAAIWYFGSIKLVANCFTLNYTLLNIITSFIVKLPLNLCIFGFSFIFTLTKTYIFSHDYKKYLFAMFPFARKNVSFDGGNNISKSLADTFETTAHILTSSEEEKQRFHINKLNDNLYNLQDVYPNGMKTFLNIKKFNQKNEFSSFRKDPTSLVFNWKGNLHNLHNKQVTDNQNAKNVIDEGSTNFALKLYKELSEKNNVPLAHPITDSHLKKFILNEEELPSNRSVITVYDQSMYNSIQEMSTIHKFLKENNISYTQITRLSHEQSDALVLPNCVIPYNEKEGYSLLDYQQVKNIDHSLVIYEIKSTDFKAFGDIVEGNRLNKAIARLCDKQVMYNESNLPINFLISIDRPNLTDGQKTILTELINKHFMKHASNYPNNKAYVTFSSSTTQDVLPLKDSWIEEIASIFNNII